MAKLRSRISRAGWHVGIFGLTASLLGGGCGGGTSSSAPGEFKQPTTTMPSELKPDTTLSQPPKLKPPD